MTDLPENSNFNQALIHQIMLKQFLPKEDNSVLHRSAQDVESAIKALISNTSDGFPDSSLEVILDVIYYPEQLPLLVDPRVTPVLFGILRRCPEAHSAFSFITGSLLFKCLALTTSVGLLAQNGKLEPFIRSIDASTRTDRTDVSPLMSTWLMDMINEDVSSPEVMLANIRTRLGWTVVNGEPVCLLGIGGHSFVTSLDLMSHGIRGRDGALTTYMSMPALGWPVILLVMWAQIRSVETEYTTLFMTRLREVVLRYCLVSAPNEHFVVQALMDGFTGFILPGEKHPPPLNTFNVMGVDATNISTALVEQLSFRQADSTSTQLKFITRLTDYALQVLKEPRRPLLEAAFGRLWHEIACSNKSLDRDFSEHVMLFSALLFRTIDKHFPQSGIVERLLGPAHVQEAISVLVKADIISAFARLLLLPSGAMSHDTSSTSASAVVLNENLRLISNLTQHFSQRSDFTHSAFSEEYPDWLKTVKYMTQLRYMQARQDHSPYPRMKECIQTWAQLGQALGYLHYVRRTQCRYPRCAGGMEASSGFMVCDICSEAIYCSARCQQADWEYDADPHGDICGESEEFQ